MNFTTAGEFEPKRFARAIEHLLKSRTERVYIPAVTKTVGDSRPVRKELVRTVERDQGPAWFVIGVAGLLAAAGCWFAMAADQLVAGLVILAGGAGFYLWASGRFRRTGIERETYYEDSVEAFTREVVVEPERFEDRVVNSSATIRMLARVPVPFLAVGIDQNTVLFGPAQVGTGTIFRYPTPADGDAIRNQLDFIDKTTASVPFVLADGPVEKTAQPADIQRSDAVLRGMESQVAEAYGRVEGLFRELKFPEFLLLPVGKGTEGLEGLVPCPESGMAPGLEGATALRTLMGGPDGEALEKRSAECLEEWTDRQFATHGVRFDSLHLGLAPLCFNLGGQFDLSAFNFYCPVCAGEQAEELLRRDYSVAKGEEHPPFKLSLNTRCRFDQKRRVWRCLACESEVTNAIPVHRALDEVLLPTYDRLMEENKNERLAIYAKARDSELEYTNRRETEAEEIFRENRGGVELLRRELLRAQAEMEGEQAAIASLLTVAATAKVTTSEALNQITKEAKELAVRMEEDRAVIRQEMTDFYEKERKEMVQVMNACARAERIDQQKRDQVMTEINSNMVGLRQDVREGFDRVEGAVKETTAAVRETTAAVKETTAAVRETTAAVEENTVAVRETTAAVREGTEELGSRMDSQLKESRTQTSIAAALAQNFGVDIGPKWTSPIDKLKALLGRATNYRGDDASDAAFDLEYRK